MRVRINGTSPFFDELLRYNKCTSLISFSKLSGINYSNLKQYGRGRMSIPHLVFNILVSYHPRKKYWNKRVIFLEDNWGCKKGGIVSAGKRNNKKNMAYVRRFRRILKIKIKLNKQFCEFYGALLGDGCISRYLCSDNKERWSIQLVGNLRSDYKYILYLQKLLLREYNLSSYYYRRRNNSCALTIKNKGLCLDLNKKFGVPIGPKYKKLNISNKVLTLPWGIKKYVLRGLFDTDGIIFARKDENYRSPHISITSKSKPFLRQIMGLLREQGYPAYINGSDVRIRGIKNINKWFEDIGSSNPRNLNKYEYFLKYGYVPNQSAIGPVG